MREIAMSSATEQRIKRQAGDVETSKMKLKIHVMRESRKCQKHAVSFLKDVFGDASPEILVLAKRKIRSQFLSATAVPDGVAPTDSMREERRMPDEASSPPPVGAKLSADS
jgi:hypothetical protein